MFESIKAKAKEAYDNPKVQAVKDTLMDIGKSKLDSKLDEQSAKAEAKLKKIDDKLNKFGIDLFDPEEVMETVTGAIKNEHGEREALRDKLDAFREKLEADAEKKDGNVLSKYASALCDRAQDAFTTAVVDGVIKEMTPDSIKNPLSALFGGDESGGDDFDYSYGDGDIANAEFDGEGSTGEKQEEKKKGFLDTAADLFNKAKDIAMEVGTEALENKLSGNKESNKSSLLSTVLSASGLTPTDAKPGDAQASASLISMAAKACTAGFSAAMAPAQENPEGTNSAGFLSKMQSVASAMVSSVSNQNTTPEGAANNATGSSDGKGEQKQQGLLDYFKNPMALLQNDTTGNLLEKTTETVISRVAKDVAAFAKEPSFDNLTKTIGKAYDDAIAGTTAAGKEFYNGLANAETNKNSDNKNANATSDSKSTSQETPGPFSITSITNAIVEQAFKTATDKGDTEALVKNVVEQKVIFCSGAKCCGGCCKSCNQTPSAVKNLLVAAEVLGVDLNTAKIDEIKPPSETTNLPIDESKQIAKIEEEEEPEFPEPEVEAYDLLEFEALIANGTMLAKILMGEEEFNRCLGLYEMQKASETLVA